LLDSLQTSKNLLVALTNENLGPALVDRTTYIRKAFTNHLSDTKMYKHLSPIEAALAIAELKTLLKCFVIQLRQTRQKQPQVPPQQHESTA
jgi:hypothetical protein